MTSHGIQPGIFHSTKQPPWPKSKKCDLPTWLRKLLTYFFYSAESLMQTISLLRKNCGLQTDEENREKYPKSQKK